MKKLAAFLLTIVMLCGMSLTVFAKSVNINASVQNTHIVTFNVSGAGIIKTDGQPQDNSVEVERLKPQTYQLIPDNGYEIDTLIYNGVDVTDQIVNGYFTAPPITENTVLTVIYRKAGSIVSTTRSDRSPTRPVKQTTAYNPDNTKINLSDTHFVATGNGTGEIFCFALLCIISLLAALCLGRKKKTFKLSS